MDLLKQQMQKNETTVVIVTHSVELAAQCQRAIHIRDGLIQEMP